jgi:transcriptional regulator with XRE-family HTH domain
MSLGERLRALREGRNLSQSDVAKKTGLLRCNISRVENGHTTPSVETLERFARALDVPMYQLFYAGEKPPKLPSPLNHKTEGEVAWGDSGKDARTLARFRQFLGRTTESKRKLLLLMAQRMAGKGAV